MIKIRGRALAEIDRNKIETDGDDLIIFGRASAGNLDRKGTFIDQDSLWDAVKRFTTRTVFWQHDWNAPIGTVDELVRGDNELLAQARIGTNFDIPVALGLGGILWNVENIRALIRQGIVRGYSIGFDGMKREDKNGGPPTIYVTDFMELSICSVPANEKTTFGFARSAIIDGMHERRNEISKITSVTPARFEFAPEHSDEMDELEVLKVALEDLRGAVADWK